MDSMKTNFSPLPAVRPSQRKTRQPANEVNIGARSTFHLLGNHRGDRIDVLTGLIWVTQPGDTEDHLLRRGESFVITHTGTVVAQGMAESALRVVQPR
jgi:hypothetical protein